MLFVKGTAPFAITMYPLNYGNISFVPFAIRLFLLSCTPLLFMCPLSYVKISIVPFAILIFTLCLQNSGENTEAGVILTFIFCSVAVIYSVCMTLQPIVTT